MHILDHIVFYVEAVAVKKEYRLKGTGRQIIQDLKDCMRDFIGRAKPVNALYIMVGLSESSRPHKFYFKLGFNLFSTVAGYESWYSDDRLDPVYLHIQPNEPIANLAPR
jgi:GNAT superfamily N-acetyltransferase